MKELLALKRGLKNLLKKRKKNCKTCIKECDKCQFLKESIKNVRVMYEDTH